MSKIKSFKEWLIDRGEQPAPPAERKARTPEQQAAHQALVARVRGEFKKLSPES